MPTQPLKIDTISLSAFKTILARYPEHIPATLSDLEHFRSQTITRTLTERRARKASKQVLNPLTGTSGPTPTLRGKKKKPSPPSPALVVKRDGPHLTKEELVKLVEWKLYVKLSPYVPSTEEKKTVDPRLGSEKTRKDVEKPEPVKVEIAYKGRSEYYVRRGKLNPAERSARVSPNL
jgi:hypothetical protein